MFLQIGNTLRRCCEQAPDCDCNVEGTEENSPVLLPSPTEVAVPEWPGRPLRTPYWVIIMCEIYSTCRHTTHEHFLCFLLNGISIIEFLLLCSIVSPPTCGCCWDILLWWSSTPWPASSPGSWSSPSLSPRWTQGPWASFFSWLRRMFLSPPAHRGRQGKDQFFSSIERNPKKITERWFFACFIFFIWPSASRLWDQSSAVLLPRCKLVLLQVHCWWDQCVRRQYPLPVNMCVYVWVCLVRTCCYPWLRSQTSSLL